MSECCHHESKPPVTPSCHNHKKSFDYLLWISLGVIVVSYVAHLFLSAALMNIAYLHHFTEAIFTQTNTIWYGLLIGMLFVGLLEQVPREFVMKVLGKGGSFQGILRATLAGMLFDLCSHGILLIAGKLYERGASLGQVMAFLIASPWNSISLTIILFTLIGIPWTLVFIAASLVIALISGVLFDYAVRIQKLPSNPNQYENGEFAFWTEAKTRFIKMHFDASFFNKVLRDVMNGSTMILRWLLLGLILAALSRTFIPTDHFAIYFGATYTGLMITLLVATVIEVCSEGSVPIAADIFTRAHAPGNAFAFLMTGVSTDYTEILVLRQMTGSWKVAFCLPLLTLPQVIVLSVLMNHF
jgi:hypothetical protein